MSTTPESSSPEIVPATAIPPELPPAPRSSAGRPARVITGEPRTRSWLIAAGIFLVIAAYFLVVQMSNWAAVRSLVANGVHGKAKVLLAGGAGTVGQRGAWDAPVRISIEANGQTYIAEGQFIQRPGGTETVSIGELVDIRYDPADPRRWTNGTAAPPLAASLIKVYGLAPFGVLMAAIGIWQRSRLLKSWRTGELAPAVVLSVTSNPAAPDYSHISAAPSTEEGRQAGAVGVYLPRKLGTPRRGDVIWLVLPANGPALAAKLFQ